VSPRPRTVSNAEILEGAARAISELGAARLTLADVAEEVGLAPATLLQRFGSKRDLLLALVEQSVADVEVRFDAARGVSGSPLAAVFQVATEESRNGISPSTLVNHLVFLHFDLDDPDFSRLAQEQARLTLNGYKSLLDDAVLHGELAPCDTRRLARALQAMISGSLLNWASHREGEATAWLKADLDGLLAPHRLRVTRDEGMVTELGNGALVGTPIHRPSGPRARHASR
jgi:AcrR family transcriptional regulator